MKLKQTKYKQKDNNWSYFLLHWNPDTDWLCEKGTPEVSHMEASPRPLVLCPPDLL